MQTFHRFVLIPTLAASVVLAASSCYVGAAPEQGTVATVSYEPMYHDGYAVYYSDGGLPYYYLNGAVVYVPSSSPYYAGYSNYYRTHRTQYQRWNHTHGQRYRTQRRTTPAQRRGTPNRGRNHRRR